MLEKLTAKLHSALVSPARDGIRALRGGAQGLLEKRSEREHRRNALAPHPATPAEMEANAAHLVTSTRQRLLADHGTDIASAIGGSLWKDDSGVPQGQPPVWRIHPARVPWVVGQCSAFELFCLLGPTVTAAGLADAAKAATKAAPVSTPLAERRLELERLEAEIIAIEAEHTALADEAAAVGVSIPLLESEAGRRTAAKVEAERQRRQADLAALDERLRWLR